MANFNADIAANLAATPPVRDKTRQINGRVRWFEATFTALAANPQIADTITWGTLPNNCRPIGHLALLSWSAGTVACTLNLGDAASVARHLAATGVNVAGSAVPNATQANGGQFDTTDISSAATNNCTLISTVAGAVVAVGQVITLRFPYVAD